MKSGITYDEMIPTKAYIVRARSTVNDTINTFSQPFLARSDAITEMQQLEKRLQYHKLWVATLFV